MPHDEQLRLSQTQTPTKHFAQGRTSSLKTPPLGLPKLNSITNANNRRHHLSLIFIAVRSTWLGQPPTQSSALTRILRL